MSGRPRPRLARGVVTPGARRALPPSRPRRSLGLGTFGALVRGSPGRLLRKHSAVFGGGLPRTADVVALAAAAAFAVDRQLRAPQPCAPGALEPIGVSRRASASGADRCGVHAAAYALARDG